MNRSIRTAVFIAALAILAIIAVDSCKPVTFGTTGSGGALAVEYGDPPGNQGVRPIGVAEQGSHAGDAAWVLAAGLAGAAGGKLAAAAVRAVGNDPLSMTGDPCQDQPGRKKVAAWRRTFMHPPVWLDCSAWHTIRKYRVGKLSISTVIRCITRTIGAGVITAGIGQAAKYTWNWEYSEGFGPSTSGTTTVLTDESGRITSAYVEGRWTGCAGIRATQA